MTTVTPKTNQPADQPNEQTNKQINLKPGHQTESKECKMMRILILAIFFEGAGITILMFFPKSVD